MLNIAKQVISEILYLKRMDYNLSQEKMAAKCCISSRQYNDLENGKRIPSFSTLLKIVISCEIDLNEIIDRIKKRGFKVTDDKNAS